MFARTSLLLALGAALALPACTRPEPAPQPVGAVATATPRDRLISALEAEGCVFSRETSGAVLLRANLTRAEAILILDGLGNEGRVQAGGTPGAETVRLLSPGCPAT